MLKIELATKLLYYTASGTYYNEDFMNAKTYDISYPFNQLDEKYTKNVYASLENVEHKNIKGNYYIYYHRKIDLNKEDFLNQTIYHGDGWHKTGKGWIQNTTSRSLNSHNDKAFNPVIVKRYTDHDEYLKDDILKVKQYILFKRKFFQYINLKSLSNGSLMQASGKNSFPLYLLRNRQEINDNFQFFCEYEDKSLGFFTNETVTLYYRLSFDDI